VQVEIARLRRPLLLMLAGVLGAAVVVLPAVAGSETVPTVNALSNPASCGSYYPNCWSPANVEVTSPGTVAFKNASGEEHGVVWSSVPVTPSCSGVPVNSRASSFSGTCSFSQPGTYSFYCSVHGPNMSGTITVKPNGTTTTTTTPTTPTSTATTPTSTATTPAPTTTIAAPGESPGGSPLVGGPSLRSSQHGGSVKGSLDVSRAGAGDRLEIDLFVRRASLARAPAPASRPVRVGRLVRSSVAPGRVSFSVPLTPVARHALKRRHRLALTVRITLAPARGAALSITRAVVVRG
jgi:plastocyanin